MNTHTKTPAQKRTKTRQTFDQDIGIHIFQLHMRAESLVSIEQTLDLLSKFLVPPFEKSICRVVDKGDELYLL
ncbi:hypothetical protein GN244_ATG02141 [Phytophthora infestans]|uniref:Uncharacterized protein n=1 Tax=Phytophthora infestans TaxID=4787 RepID=A0A833T8T0_PHYIN|nr:hypothetical protein GN244_ATG02141 [Phytophthora infestans]